MTEHELRMLVRDAIARQLAPRDGTLPPSLYTLARDAGGRVSYAQFAVPSGPEGTCIIEPSVQCNHCGYCKSYGH